MSTFAMEELIAQFPPFTPHRLCNPLHCKNKNLKTPSLAKAIEVESVLLKFFQEHRLSSIIFSISVKEMKLPALLATLVANSVNSTVNSIENKQVLEKFKINLKNELEAALITWKGRSWDSFVAIVLSHTFGAIDQNYRSLCLCSAAEPVTLGALRDYSANRETDPELRIEDIAMLFSQTNPNFQEYQSQMIVAKQWNEKEIKKFTFNISSIIRNVFQVALAGHEAMVYLEAYEKLVGGVAMLEYGRIIIESSHSYPGSVMMIPFGVRDILDTLSHMAINFPTFTTLAQLLDALKQVSDRHAHEKHYPEAITRYTQLNTVPTFDNSVKLNSLTNCAAIRLRTSDTEPWQLPFAIMECTFALEIDPNHGKALFRRGLALALLKKWDEAIVDFQRAVELDSRSPAAKELAVALRQVGRRIEA